MDIPKDILIQAAEGNMRAFKQVYDAAGGFVYSVALRITNNRPDAEEVTQDVFMQIYSNLKNFRFESAFKTWVYRIATNAAINKYTQAAREKNRRQEYKSAADVLHPVYKDPEFIAQESSEKNVTALLSALNPKQRACILLREVEGLSYKEIAEALKVNINTVRTRLKRAREALLAQTREGAVSHEL